MNMDLLMKAKNGDMDAKNTIVKENIGLVYNRAKKYTKYIEKDVAVQEGSIGLLKAIENFDESKECRFSTYATSCIDGHIKRCIANNQETFISVKTSRTDFEIKNKIEKEQRDIQNKLGISISFEEAAKKICISEKTAKRIKNEFRYTKSLHERAFYYANTDEEVLKIDMLKHDDQFEEYVENKILIEKALSRLTEEEKEIINLRYFKDLTQREIAEMKGLSQVRISRMETRILKKMKETINNKYERFVYIRELGKIDTDLITKNQLQILKLYYNEHMKIKYIAEKLNKSRNNISNTKVKALRKLGLKEAM